MHSIIKRKLNHSNQGIILVLVDYQYYKHYSNNTKPCFKKNDDF